MKFLLGPQHLGSAQPLGLGPEPVLVPALRGAPFPPSGRSHQGLTGKWPCTWCPCPNFLASLLL